MFIEDLLSPLREEPDKTIKSLVYARSKILDLLSEIENRPIKANELSLIRFTLINYLRKFRFEDELNILEIINSRLSFEYLPFVSGAKIEPFNSKPLEVSKQQSNVSKHAFERKVEQSASLAAIKSNVYYMCSIRRQISALYIIYRMYLDGTKEFDVKTNEFHTYLTNEPPIELFVAKKFKSGLSTSCFVWSPSESKLFKEKNAFAKITRSSDNRYTGLPLRSNGATSLQQLPEMHSNCNGNSVSGDVKKSATAVDCTNEITEGTFILSSTSSSTLTDNDRLKGECDATNKINVNSLSLHSMYDHTTCESTAFVSVDATSNYDNNRSQATPVATINQQCIKSAGSFICKENTELLQDDDAIVVSVNSRGMDKLIHIVAVVVMQNTTTKQALNNVNSINFINNESVNYGDSSCSNNYLKNGSSVSIEKVLNAKLSRLLCTNKGEDSSYYDNDVDTTVSASLSSSSSSLVANSSMQLLYLRSKLPRRVPVASNASSTAYSRSSSSSSGSHIHTVAFGKHSRVRLASRKNLVIEQIATAVMSSTDEEEEEAESSSCNATHHSCIAINSKTSPSATSIASNPCCSNYTNNNDDDCGHETEAAAAVTTTVAAQTTNQPQHRNCNQHHPIRLQKQQQQDGHPGSVEWSPNSATTNTMKPPLLQIGKLEESLFSVDFYELSYFQAFTIAIAALDQ